MSLQARARISSTLKAIIEERRRNNKAENSQKKSSNSDFLEILLTTNTFSEDETVSFVLDVILGGYETTSILMAMLVLFLSQCPKALQQLKVINHKGYSLISISRYIYIHIYMYKSHYTLSSYN